LVTANHKSCL
jgi:hypothetical protein